jgi:hypothetical protein
MTDAEKLALLIAALRRIHRLTDKKDAPLRTRRVLGVDRRTAPTWRG